MINKHNEEAIILKILIDGVMSELDIDRQSDTSTLLPERHSNSKNSTSQYNEDTIVSRCLSYLKRCGITMGEGNILYGGSMERVYKGIFGFEKALNYKWKMRVEEDFVRGRYVVKLLGATRM